MLTVAVLLLFSLVTLSESKGVNRWCTQNNKFLHTYSSGNFAYRDLATAKTQCLQRSDCFGITREGGWRYTLRKDWVLRDSPSREVSYVPCGGYFRCPTFGLKSVHGKFLSAQSDGGVEWNRDRYGSWERITFEQYGEDSGFLKSYHGKYLAATNKRRLEWNRDWARGWEKFKVYQYEDKVAFQSYHGRYLSAQSDGSVDVDRTAKGSWEWFTVVPQNCLNNIECDCSKGINENDYELEVVEYHPGRGEVRAYTPERVGFQHIDNEDSSVEQSTQFAVSESVTETASFTHTAGASVTLGTSFEVGLPLVSKGQVSASVTASYEFSAGTEKSETKTMSATYNCVAPAGKNVSCEALLFKYRMTVPYTMTWQHKRLPCTCKSQGVFTEVAASEMRMSVDES